LGRGAPILPSVGRTIDLEGIRCDEELPEESWSLLDLASYQDEALATPLRSRGLGGESTIMKTGEVEILGPSKLIRAA